MLECKHHPHLLIRYGLHALQLLDVVQHPRFCFVSAPAPAYHLGLKWDLMGFNGI
jgi:hypothetical protein